MQIALNSLRTLLFRVVYVGLGWVLSILTARWLGPQGNGLYTLATIYGAIGTTVMSGGVAAVAYEISNKGTDSRTATANVSVLSLITGFVPMIAALALWPVLQTHGWWWLLPVALAQPAALLGAALVGVFLGSDDIRRLNYAYLGPWVATLVLFVVLAMLFGHTVGVALLAWVLGQVCSAAYSLWLSRNHWWPLALGAVTAIRMQGLIKFGLLAGLANLVGFLNYRMDAIMVEYYLGQAPLGVYAVGVRVAEGLWFFSQAIMTASYARIGSSSAGDSAHLTARGMRHSALIIGAMALVLLIAAGPLVRMLYGEAYAGAITPFRWLVPGIAFYGLASILSAYYTNQLGRPRIPLVIATVSMIINLSVCALLIPNPRFGLSGAAIASTLGYTIAIVAGLVLFQRHTRVSWREIVLVTPDDLRDYLLLARRLLDRRLPSTPVSPK